MYISIVPLKFGVDIQSQTKVKTVPFCENSFIFNWELHTSVILHAYLFVNPS